jgi:hypothetical protein
MKAATRYDLPLEFCQKLYDKLTDKGYFERAVRMFVDGRLKYSDAINDNSLDCEAVRHEVAQNLVKLRETRREALELRMRVTEYYAKECFQFALDYRTERRLVFVDKETRTLSAIARVDMRSKEISFYYANNSFEKYGEEHLHDYMIQLRLSNKAFVRHIKKACVNEPATTFKFDDRTIRNK